MAVADYVKTATDESLRGDTFYKAYDELNYTARKCMEKNISLAAVMQNIENDEIIGFFSPTIFTTEGTTGFIFCKDRFLYRKKKSDLWSCWYYTNIDSIKEKVGGLKGIALTDVYGNELILEDLLFSSEPFYTTVSNIVEFAKKCTKTEEIAEIV